MIRTRNSFHFLILTIYKASKVKQTLDFLMSGFEEGLTMTIGGLAKVIDEKEWLKDSERDSTILTFLNFQLKKVCLSWNHTLFLSAFLGPEFKGKIWNVSEIFAGACSVKSIATWIYFSAHFAFRLQYYWNRCFGLFLYS